jgi:hypothetical protein
MIHFTFYTPHLLMAKGIGIGNGKNEVILVRERASLLE